MEKQNNINELNMDLLTYNKVKGKLNPNEKNGVTITGEKPTETSSSSSSSSSTSVATQMEESEVIPSNDSTIEPKDKSTIKYLSNIKDRESGEISKPFTIGNKKYQMVRGSSPDKSVVMGVYSFDEIDESGENIIHPVDYFEENIAKPMREMDLVGQDSQVVNDEFNYASAEVEHNGKESFMNYLNLTDIDPTNKHFFVDITDGKIIANFKNTKEMVKSGVKLGPNQDYMDLKALKRFRFGDYFKNDIQENNLSPEDANTNIPKLQSDVKKLANLIKNKFSIYLTKLDKPIEQAQFLTAMANEIGVPLNKLSSIISTYKDIAKQEIPISPTAISENKIITKKILEESLKNKRVIKVIKVKNVFDE